MHELRVLTGLHLGAALPLIGDQWLIGNDERRDLFLQDPGIAGRHCCVVRTGAHWRVEAEDGSLVDDHGLPCDELSILAVDQPFRLATVTLSIMHSTSPWPAPERPSHAPGIEPRPVAKRPALSKRLGAAALVITLAGSAWALSGPAQLNDVQRAHENRSPNTLNAEDTTEKLLAMLRERELRDVVSLQRTDEGIELHGALTQEQMALYHRMLERFHQQQSSDVAVLDRAKPFGRQLPFEIVQIAGGKDAHVMLADHRRLFLGDEVDGLRLTRIDKDHVEFDGDEHFEISW